MSTALEGIKNFLEIINAHWTTIVVILGLGIGVYRKVRNYISLSNEQKISLAWDSISRTILSMVSDAESNYADWKKSGEIKRAEVINRIFTEYPILELITNRQEVINRINDMIDESLVTVREVIEKNDNENEE